MFTVYLVRHGDINVKKGTYYGSTEYDLSPAGISQMKETARLLKEKEVDMILSSPLKRACQSADIISEMMNLPYQVEDLLKEKGFGIFEGLTYEDILKRYKEEAKCWQNDWYSYEISGGESASSLHQRCLLMAAHLKREMKNVIVVSHQGCLRYLIAALLELDGKNMWRFSVPYGKIAQIIVNDEGFAYLEV